jgi:hypothetical protein
VECQSISFHLPYLTSLTTGFKEIISTSKKFTFNINPMKTKNQNRSGRGWPAINIPGKAYGFLFLITVVYVIASEGVSLAQSSQTPTQTVCPGTEPYMVTATPGSSYNWTITPGTSGASWLIHGTGNAISVDWIAAGAYSLTVVETNAYSCTGAPVSVAVTVLPMPDVNPVSSIATMNGSVVNAPGFSGSVSGTVFNWTNDNPSIGLAASGTGNLPSFTAINTGTSAVVATISVTPVYTGSGITCTGAAQSFTITVNPTTTMNPVDNAAYCAGQVADAIVFSSSVQGVTYRWTSDNTTIGLGGSGTGNIAPFTTINSGTVPVIATITVTPYIDNVAGNPVTFTITVNPLPDTSPIYHN